MQYCVIDFLETYFVFLFVSKFGYNLITLLHGFYRRTRIVSEDSHGFLVEVPIRPCFWVPERHRIVDKACGRLIFYKKCIMYTLLVSS